MYRHRQNYCYSPLTIETVACGSTHTDTPHHAACPANSTCASAQADLPQANMDPVEPAHMPQSSTTTDEHDKRQRSEEHTPRSRSNTSGSGSNLNALSQTQHQTRSITNELLLACY